jgi:hypothetical protein
MISGLSQRTGEAGGEMLQPAVHRAEPPPIGEIDLRDI